MTFLVNKNARGRVSATPAPNFKRQVLRGIFKLFLVVLLCVLVWYVTRLEFFSIDEVIVTGGETISHDEIKLRLEEELKGTYFLIVPKRFSYLFPYDRMMSILEMNPRMYNIEINRVSRNSLSVSFDEYIPHALWCTQSVESPHCYFLTSNGVAFAEAPLLTGGTLVRHDVEELTEISRGEVISPEILKSIDIFIQRCEDELGFRISSLIHTKDNDIQLVINGGGMIFIAKGKDYIETFENVKSVLASKEFKHIKPGNFNYIDARFSNKIFVKEGMGTTTEEVSEQPATLSE